MIFVEDGWQVSRNSSFGGQRGAMGVSKLTGMCCGVGAVAAWQKRGSDPLRIRRLHDIVESTTYQGINNISS